MNPDQQRKHLGSLLVGLQFGLILLLGSSVVPIAIQGEVPLGAALMAAAGLALAAWALWAYPLGSFNIRPTPRADGHVVQRGPYRWIRHPMYSSIALCGLACACATQQLWVWLALAALGLVLLTKALLEERWMAQQYPEYTDYRARTKRFVPWLL
jgi:hypothetical protein